MKIILWAVLIIFLIGLLVVTGVFGDAANLLI